MTKTLMKYGKTSRGFAAIEFTDRSGVACNIQESILATEAALWIGCADADPKIFNPGTGWLPYGIPSGVLCNTRMHITQDQAAALIEILQHFVDNGELPKPEPEPATITMIEVEETTLANLVTAGKMMANCCHNLGRGSSEAIAERDKRTMAESQVKWDVALRTLLAATQEKPT